MILDSLLVVTKEIVRVAKVTNGSTLSLMVTQFFNNLEIKSKREMGTWANSIVLLGQSYQKLWPLKDALFNARSPSFWEY